MAPRRFWVSLRRWLVWMWEHVPFVRHQRGPGLAGVREPRRPRPPFRPPQAMAAEPEADGPRGAPVTTLTRPRRRRWRAWRRRPHAGPA